MFDERVRVLGEEKYAEAAANYVAVVNKCESDLDEARERSSGSWELVGRLWNTEWGWAERKEWAEWIVRSVVVSKGREPLSRRVEVELRRLGRCSRGAWAGGNCTPIPARQLRRTPTRGAELTITKNEVLHALNKADDYLLALVRVNGDDADEIRYIRRPFTGRQRLQCFRCLPQCGRAASAPLAPQYLLPSTAPNAPASLPTRRAGLSESGEAGS